MTKTTDIIIIGGGIAGISAAARLAPEARVIVLEGEPHLAYHSTGRSAATYILNYGNTPIRALNAASKAPLEGALLGQSVLSPRGMLLLIKEGDEDHLTDFLQGSDGIENLTTPEVQKIVPLVRGDLIVGGVYEPDAQDIDVDLLLQGCARLARDDGAQIVMSAPVTAITQQASTWTVRTLEGDYEAPVVINAAGAWADVIAGLAGVDTIGLQPKRRSAVMMPVPEGLDMTGWPLFGDIAEDWYAKPDGNRLLISPADADPVPPQDAWPDDMVLAEGLDRFSTMVDIPLVRPTHSWAGLRSFVPDGTPVCGFDPEAEGFFWLAGQGGYGVQTSPALSRLAADLVLGQASELQADVVAALGVERLR